jgi:hypothetical protein
MIGEMEPGAGVQLVDRAGRMIRVEDAGYRHF